jgi:hypothetical protein
MTVSFLLEGFKACTHNRSIFTGMIGKWGGGVNSIVDEQGPKNRGADWLDESSNSNSSMECGH